MVNYFELYGLPVSFHPSQDAVKKKYYELSRQYHPDRFVQGGAEAMDEALRMSALNNQAYNTLKDKDATMSYILKYHEVLEDEEKYTLQPDFLMEMMDLNEAVSEAEIGENNWQPAVDSWKSWMEIIDEELAPLTAQYDAGDQSPTLLAKIKDAYFRKKYLLRIQERIAKFAAP